MSHDHLKMLTEAGMPRVDAETSLKIIELRYPGESLDAHIARIARATADATAEEENRVLLAQFGSDAMRAARVLLDRRVSA